MVKKVKMPGRIESTSPDGIVTGANEVLDDTKGKKQNVINADVDAELLRLDQSKQDNLTFDNTPTEESDNPVKSGGVYAADKALSDAIEAILILIPSAATALNQLADKNFVNSSIATDTATFRGTSETGLSEAQFLEWANGLTHDMNDYVFWQTIDDAGNMLFKRYKWNGTQWLYEYTLNNSSFTADQWAAIMSGITSALVEKLNGLPTNTALQQALNSKQDALTFDNVPTENSTNPVKSGGVYSAVKTEEDARLNLAQTVSEIGGDVSQIEDVIPAGATGMNKLVENASMEAYVASIIQNITSSFTLSTADGHINLTLTQTNGQVSTLTLTSSDIASAQDVANLQQLYNNLQQSKPVPVTALPETGQQQGAIYRLAGTTSYSDYMWNGSTWVLMATYNNAVDLRPKKASQNLVTSGGVFDNMSALDVSELNATENPHTLAQYNDLSAALDAITTDYRKGGMSIKFVQSSDNKYVQYLYHGTSTSVADFTKTANWEKLNIEKEVNGVEYRLDYYQDSVAGFNISGDSRESVFRQALLYAWVEKLTDDAPALPETMYLRYFRNNSGAVGAFFQIFASLSDENPIFSWYETGPLSDTRNIIVSGFGSTYSGKYRINIRVDWSKVVGNFVSNNPYITITSANLNRELVPESKTIETVIDEIGEKGEDLSNVVDGLVDEVNEFIDPLSGFDVTGEKEVEIRDAIKYCYLKTIDSSVALPENLSLIYLTNRDSSPSGCLIQVVEKGTENIVFSWYDAGPKSNTTVVEVAGAGNYNNKYVLVFKIDYSKVAEKMVWITSPVHIKTSLLNNTAIESFVNIPEHIKEHTNLFYGKNIVFLGDSITEFKDISNKRYSDYIKEFTGANIFNGAIGGSQLRMRYTAQYVKITGTASSDGQIVLNINNQVIKTASILTTDSVTDIALKIKNGTKTGIGGFYFAIDPEYPDEVVIITNTDEYGTLISSDNVSIQTETGVTSSKQYYPGGMFKNFFGDEAMTQAYSNLDIASMAKSFSLNYWTLTEAAANYLASRGDDNTSIINEMKSISINNTDMVVILGGTNDFNESSFGVAGESGKHTLSSYITDIVSTLLTANKKLKVVFLTPIPRYYYASAENPLSNWQDRWWGDNCISASGDVDDGNGWSIRLVDAINAGVKFHHIPIYDLYWSIGWNKWNFREFFNDDDGTHPYKGMKQLAEKIMEYLYNIKV